MNAAESVRKRVLTATYQSLITGEEILDKAEKIVWYFPIEGSMIYPPQLGTEYSEYELYSELTPEEIATLELPCKYCRIERAVPEAIDGDAGEEIARQTEQIFRIKDYYTQTATNNTIYCTVFKNGRQYKAEATLVFGISGTCGTDATFLLQMREWDEENACPTDKPVSALTIGKSVAIIPKFYDYNNNDITEEYLASHTVNYSWHTQEKTGAGSVVLTQGMTNPRWAKLTIDSGATIDKCQYYILAASVYWSIVKYQKDEWGRTVLDANGNPVIDETQKDLEARDVQLKTFLPIPVRTDDKYTQVVGPTQIVYSKDGTNPTYYDAPFEIYVNGTLSTASWMLSCREYLDSGTSTDTRDSRILNYYPSLNTEGKLTPKEMYLFDGQPLAVEAIVEGKVVWTQPILIIKNKYASAMLNAWDGELCIDQENGTIMSTMVGAGKKEGDNTFSGVLMGNVALGAEMSFGDGSDIGLKNHDGLGIYGFHHGGQSFGLNVNGSAFFGKAGKGRIIFNGDYGAIASSGWFSSGGAIGKINGSTQDHGITHAGTDGMCIDLEHGHIDAYNFKLTSSKILMDSSGGDKKDAYLKVVDGKNTLISIGEEDYYLQSITGNTKIDLTKSKIYLESELNSYNSILLQTATEPYFLVTGSYTPSAGVTEQKTLISLGTNNYYLQSSNFNGENGMNIERLVLSNLGSA